MQIQISSGLFTDDERQQIFSEFWNLTDKEKKTLRKHNIHTCKRKTTNNGRNF